MKKQEISGEQKKEIEAARKVNKHKNVEKRLKALLRRAEGKTNAVVGKECGYAATRVSMLVSKYCREGISAIVDNHYKGNRCNMSFAEEGEFLSKYKEQAGQGKLVEISAMKVAYEKKVGHAIGSAQIYRVLQRHGWRKVMPRSKHPKKATPEAIEASKKLTM